MRQEYSVPVGSRISRLMLLGAVLLLLGCSVSGPRVTPLRDVTVASSNGVPYTLPKTAIEAAIPMKRVKLAPTDLGKKVSKAIADGKAARPIVVTALKSKKWSDQNIAKLLGNFPPAKSLYDSAVNDTAGTRAAGKVPAAIIPKDWDRKIFGFQIKEGSTFSLQAPSLKTKAIPDSVHTYHVAFLGSATENRSISLSLSGAGFFVGAAALIKDQRVEIAKATISAIGGIAAKALGVTGAGDGLSTLPPEAVELAQEYELLEDSLSQLKLEYDQQNLANVDGSIYASVVANMEKKLKEMQGKLAKRVTTEWTYRTSYVPTPNSSGRTLFSWSKTGGVSANGSDYIHPHFKAGVKPGTGWTDYKLAVDATRDQPLLEALKKIKGSPTRGGRSFYYRLPISAEVRLEAHSGGDVYRKAEAEFLIAQLGTVGSLPARIPGSGVEYSVEMHQMLGALKTVKIASQSVDVAGVVKAVGDTVPGIIEQTGEAGRLAREKKILELRWGKHELEEKLDARYEPSSDDGEEGEEENK